jgi:hypothetical protein
VDSTCPEYVQLHPGISVVYHHSIQSWRSPHDQFIISHFLIPHETLHRIRLQAAQLHACGNAKRHPLL